ncbi:MAG: type II secretion system protein GspD, partial [Deltaproteobacteria bacterium]|nr:type II secretion system protein GspD [Deltaproteobacteria bacterium]
MLEPTPKPQPQTKPIQKKVQKKSVTIDFDNVDLLLFVKFISEVTGKNFIIDQKVKGKVNIISPTKISGDEAYMVFQSVLEVHGFTTIEAGNVIKIVPSTVARGKNIETRLREEAITTPEDKVVTQLIRLDYANPDELKKLLAPLISKSSVIISYPPSGMLIVTDVLSNIQRLMRIIDTIDVLGVGAEISVIPIEYATASILTKTLTTIFQTTGRTTRTSRGKTTSSIAAPSIKIIADERTNSLIISASEHDTLRIKQLIKILDQETPRGAGNIRVHYLQHANAEELAKVLTNLPSGKGKTATKGKAPVISKEVQIVADKATNSLVITANKQDYQAIMDVVGKLDIPRPMVYIEALIMEVSTDKSFNIGVQWLAADDIGSYDGRSIGAFAASQYPTGAIELSSAGLQLGIVGEVIE